ncbi:MAG: S8 family serine peptidase, partial [Methylophilaceae bacterium]|nr:S8 family serine peptidase [Methylophilaceae bacterium]
MQTNPNPNTVRFINLKHTLIGLLASALVACGGGGGSGGITQLPEAFVAPTAVTTYAVLSEDGASTQPIEAATGYVLVTVNPTANAEAVKSAIQTLGASVVAHQTSVNMMQVNFRDSDFPDINVLITRLKAISGVERVDLDYVLIANASLSICPNDASKNSISPIKDGWWKTSLHIDQANGFIATTGKNTNLAIVEVAAGDHATEVYYLAKQLGPVTDAEAVRGDISVYIAPSSDTSSFFFTTMFEQTTQALKDGKRVFNYSIGRRIYISPISISLFSFLSCEDRTNPTMQWQTRISSDIDTVYNPINTLLKQYDALGVVATGNYGVHNISKPFTSDNMIFVGSHDEHNQLSTHSNDGDLVDIYAPGTALSAQGAYGTSYSAPFVASTAAWIKAFKPSLTAKQLKALVLQTS